MQRITISLDETLAATLDQVASDRSYTSRSEAVRDLVREGLDRWREEHAEGGTCVANLSYVVDRRIRSLPLRLAAMQHAHHDLISSSTVVRLDHYHSMESVILRGSTAAVRAFADHVRAERGIRFGAINMLHVAAHDDHHDEGDHHHRGHRHLSPVL
ncbi:MAG: nickel-responsive transcriptional regulator NikR [Alphaproteobacteria bacterium]|nr:MAG: nickel-responsive transcriptional regulator NikR [Alphaproteobacteria bacterium]